MLKREQVVGSAPNVDGSFSDFSAIGTAKRSGLDEIDMRDVSTRVFSWDRQCFEISNGDVWPRVGSRFAHVAKEFEMRSDDIVGDVYD